MKTLKTLLVASLAFASSTATRAEISAQAWLETYYLNPVPDELPRAIRRLGIDGFLERPGHTAIAIGFIGTVFAQYPERVEDWLRQLGDLPARQNRLLAAALWQAGHPLGADLLRALGTTSPIRAEVLRLANMPSQPVVATSVQSASSMNLQWGAFLASGDERHIINILDAIGTNQPGLDIAARVSLAQNAAAHPRVLAICRAQLDRQPEEVRSVLRAALQDAVPAQPRS